MVPFLLSKTVHQSLLLGVKEAVKFLKLLSDLFFSSRSLALEQTEVRHYYLKFKFKIKNVDAGNLNSQLGYKVGLVEEVRVFF